MPIDYSKWDNLSVRDESDTEQDCNNEQSIRPFHPQQLEDINETERFILGRGFSYTKEEDSDVDWIKIGPLRNIRVHPDDKGGVLTYSSIIFTEDPNTYIPDQSKYEDGRVLMWGIEPPSSEEDDENDREFFMNKVMIQSNVGRLYYDKHNLEYPELQFINVLIERKSKHIESEEVTSAMKFTYVIKIELKCCEKDVWRRVRVPSGIALSVFHDQVICPAMGWSRAYHGYAFEDPVDGTIIGPVKNSAYIDMMHVPYQYKKVMEDKGCPLAALLRKKGDIAYYTYDLGDNWLHRLVLEDIVAEEDGVTLMEGAGACPPEDSNGLDAKGYRAYRDFLKEYKRNPKKQKMKEAIKEIRRSNNYARSWIGGLPIPFKPLEFNIEYHRMLMKAMIAGPSVKTPKGVFAVTDGKFKESFKGCDNCGNRLKTLSKCAGCRKASYCSRECQVQAWKVHKVECKKHSVHKAKK